MTYEERYSALIAVLKKLCKAFIVERINYFNKRTLCGGFEITGTYHGISTHMTMYVYKNTVFVRLPFIYNKEEDEEEKQLHPCFGTELQTDPNVDVWHTHRIVESEYQAEVKHAYDITDGLLIEELVMIYDGITPEWLQ